MEINTEDKKKKNKDIMGGLQDVANIGYTTSYVPNIQDTNADTDDNDDDFDDDDDYGDDC